MKWLRRLGWYLIACAGVCTIAACAGTPMSAKKVQTTEELLIKFKKAFYAGSFTAPDFYAKELGYPLQKPLNYSPQQTFDINSDEGITFFDEGGLNRLLKYSLRQRSS